MKTGSIAIQSPPALAASRPLKLAMWGWAVFFAYLVVQCLAYQAFVARVAVDAWDSVTWSVREWGVWLVITPALVWSVVEWRRSREWLMPLLASLGCLAAALGFRAWLDSSAASALGSLVYFLPKYLGAWVVVLAAGAWLSRAPKVDHAQPAQPADGRTDSAPRTLLVYAGRDQCLLDLARVDVFSAAKNYVDVYCEGRTYLLRSTLKQIEEGLPPGEFIRTHRSHLVRVSAIARVRLLPSGTGVVVLRDGSTVALSKKHYRDLVRFRSLPS